MKKKALIVNAHWSNRGDEAALRALIDKLVYDNQECWDFRIMFKDRKQIQYFPYEKVTQFNSHFLPRNLCEVLWAIYCNGNSKFIKNKDMAKAIQEIKRSDLLIYSPGGGVICDRFWWVKQLEYLLPFICAKKYGIPIVVASPSMGPFDKEKSCWRKKYIYNMLKNTDCICVRENISYKYLKTLGDFDNIKVTIDTAFLDDNQSENIKLIIKDDKRLLDFFDTYKKVIGITITDFSWHVKYAKDKKLTNRVEYSMKKFIKEMGNRGIGVLLIPQLFGNQNDISILRRYENPNTEILSEKYDTYIQQGIIANLYSVIGMRYHSNIFAAKGGVPFLAIAYEEKMQGFMEDWKMEKWSIKLSELNYEYLIEKYNLLEQEYVEYKNKLICYREVWRKLALKTIEKIEECMYR